MKLLLLASIIGNLYVVFMPPHIRPLTVRAAAADSSAHYKISAFRILQSSCNVCHTQRNRNAVFTFDNMNAWSGEIHEQVFVKKRMPKGTAIVLSQAEKATLTKWINSIK